MRLVFQDGTEWDIRADVEFAGLIIWAAICPNSLRPEFIPINFKTLVWPTGAVPEKTFRSKSVTYENPTLKTVESRSGAVATDAAPFPLPAHQTGRADFPHPAFGQGFFMLSPTAG